VRKRKSTWFQEDSPFCESLKTAFPDAEIVPFLWSGDNSYLARHHAAEQLAYRMMQCHDEKTPPRQFIIAHSHGGSIAHIACRHPWSPALTGIVAMATPFLEIERRTEDDRQEALLGYLQTATLLLLGACITILLFAWFDARGVFSTMNTARWTSWPFANLGWAGSSALLICLWIVSGPLQRVRPIRAAVKKARGWPANPQVPWLVVRTAGDEASRWLERARKAYSAFDFTWRRVRGAIAVIAPALKYGWPTLLLLTPAPWVHPSLTTFARRLVLHEPWAVAWHSVVPDSGWLTLGSPFMVPVLVLLAVVGVILFGAGVLISPFGWEFYVMGLAFEIRATETPPRSSHTMAQVSFSWAGRRHSVYESPEARARIADWIEQQPTADPASRPYRIVT
jgi:hypothetical protein